MAQKQDWDAVMTAAAADLRPGEQLTALFPAIPSDGPAGASAPSELMPLIIAVEHLAWRRRIRTSATSSMFPTAPRMLIGLTGHRLVVWSAARRWRPGKFLGYVTRDRLIQATAPTVGSGWRTVVIYLANEPPVSLKVPGPIADDVARMLPLRAQ